MGRCPSAVPIAAGIGLRAEHYRAVLDERPAAAWFEVHPENFMGAGGEPTRVLERVRADTPVSFHGIGLSLGSTDPLDRDHLRRLKSLIEHFEPGLVSEHVAWSSVGGLYSNDLLPLPYTEEALAHLCDRVSRAQDALGRALLMENPSSYVRFTASTIPEPEFLIALAEVSGCGLLLDVNNVYVQSANHGFSPEAYLDALPGGLVHEIHLAGHTERVFADGRLLIDSHDQPVCAPVWALYGQLIARIGPRPTLIEWDAALPPLPVLRAEAARAQAVLETAHAHAL